MKILFNLLTVFLLPIFIFGCPSAGVMQQTKYPARLEGIGESPNYPLQAAGFDRAEIMTYEPGMTNISTAYNYRTPTTQIAATIYRYKKMSLDQKLGKQFELEKATIEKIHHSAKLLYEDQDSFRKQGKEFVAFKASYEFEGLFMKETRLIYSELILIDIGYTFIKLRSSAPISQKEVAAKKNIELMNVVNWAN